MRVQVGPVPSNSATIWIAYARTMIARLDPSAVPADAVAEFASFLDEWEVVGRQGGEFVWEADLDAERVEYLAHVWFGLAGDLAGQAEERGYPLLPREGDVFYQALLRAMLDAMAADAPARAEFSTFLREQWPGFEAE